MARPKQKRGFAVMDPEVRRRIASRGGKATQAKGNAHRFTPEQAREAGRKGGKSLSANRAWMSYLGTLSHRKKKGDA